jgi:hypothetical protein
MSPKDIRHFLLIFDVKARELHVEEYGTDYAAALSAYDEREKEYREAGRVEDFDIVLLGADSLETVKKTHSSYFDGDAEHGFAAYFKPALPTP